MLILKAINTSKKVEVKILYAIQGTGNGHITRSLSMIKELRKYFEVDILISGTHNELQLPIEVTYAYKGLGFIFGKHGGINYRQTFKQWKLSTLYSEIKRLPIENYSLVISDFEPISVWAASSKGIPTIGVSNQVSVLHPTFKKSWDKVSASRIFLQNYARCHYNIGLHFEPIDHFIETPIIRSEIRDGLNTDEGFGLVYLPFYSDEKIQKLLKGISNLEWKVFSKHSKKPFKDGNIEFIPVENELFNKSLLACHLVITAAGFGTTTEALHLGKKLIVIPMKGQLEQKFNAQILKKYGVTVLKSIDNTKPVTVINKVISGPAGYKMNYPDNKGIIAQKIVNLYNGPILNSPTISKSQISQSMDYNFNQTHFHDNS